jgi:small conductance mechanosensitive channel
VVTEATPSRNAGSIGTLDEGFGRLEQLGSDVVASLPALGVALVILAMFLLLAAGTRTGVQRYAARRRKQTNLVLAAGRLVYGGIVVLGALVAAVVVFPNFTPTGLLTSLGVGSLVLGLAFKDILRNYLAGILLLATEPFRIGDQVIVAGFEGTVEEIEPRATFIRTYDGRRVVVPNGEMFEKVLVVNTAFERRRVEYDVGIGVEDDVERAKALILEAVAETGSALSSPAPEVLTYDLDDYSVKLRVRWWIQPPEMAELFDARDKVLAAIKVKLLSNGIDLPYPTHHVVLQDRGVRPVDQRSTR